MLISHDPAFIFVHIQRTGGTTIVNLLKQQLGVGVTILSEHGNARTEEGKLLLEYPDYFTFTFIRNPWERILSWYALIHREHPLKASEDKRRFERFLEQDAAADFSQGWFHYNQLDYLTDEQGVLRVNNIFRFDHFEAECRRLFAALGLVVRDIPRINAAPGRDYREFYGSRSFELVAEKCRRDIDYWGFTV